MGRESNPFQVAGPGGEISWAGMLLWCRTCPYHELKLDNGAEAEHLKMNCRLMDLVENRIFISVSGCLSILDFASEAVPGQLF